MLMAQNICVILRGSLGGGRVGCDILNGYYISDWSKFAQITIIFFAIVVPVDLLSYVFGSRCCKDGGKLKLVEVVAELLYRYLHLYPKEGPHKAC
jgi:hypothetical protein